MGKRKQFTPDFKREAVRLMESSKKPSSEVARELRVRRNQLYKWKEQLAQRDRDRDRGHPLAGRSSRHGRSCGEQILYLLLFNHFVGV